VNTDQQIELENIIKDLEEENKLLMDEYGRLQNQLNAANMVSSNYSTNSKLNQTINNQMIFSTPYQQIQAQQYYSRTSQSQNKDTQIIEEAKLLREHESRLEARMKVLETHNKLLDSQLRQLRTLLNPVSCFFCCHKSHFEKNFRFISQKNRYLNIQQ
jgi:hypothetical protein